MTRARRDQLWRRQAARLIVAAKGVRTWDLEKRFDAFDQVFDVARVRAYCERLIYEADALDQQSEVFADWTRERGKGPESTPSYPLRSSARASRGSASASPIGILDIPDDGWVSDRLPSIGEHVEVWLRAGVVTRGTVYAVEWWENSFAMRGPRCLVHQVDPDHAMAVWSRACVDAWIWLGREYRADCDGLRWRHDPARVQPGWPGNLAREFASEQRKRRRCSRPDCDGGVLIGTKCECCINGPPKTCPECHSLASTRTSRAFVNGGNMRRAAQRLLDTLDGRCPWATDAEAQPSECPKCSGTGADSWTGPIASMVRSGQPAVPTPGASVTITTPKGCIACNGTGNNLRGVLPRLPGETLRRLHSNQIAMRLRAPACACDGDPGSIHRCPDGRAEHRRSVRDLD